MTKVIKKLLSITLSLALMLTGFTFLGGAKIANAEGETDTIQIKVVDQNGNAVSGVSLTCTDEDDHEVDYGTSNEDGIAVHTINKQFEFYDVETEYTITSDDSDVVVTSPVVFTILWDNNSGGMYYETANNEAYTGGVVNLVIQSDDPQPTGFEITFDPGDDGMLNIDDKTATTGEDGKLTSLPTPTVEDEELVFTKWVMYTEDDEEVEVTTDTVFTDNTTVYAQYESVWEWNATDFTYGELKVTAEDDIEAIYPGNDREKYLRDSFWVVTGFSSVGAEKVKVNRYLELPAVDSEGKEVQGVGPSAFSGSSNNLKNNKLEGVAFPENVMSDVNVYGPNETWKSVANKDLEKRGNFVIGRNAFNKNELTYLELPEGVLSVGQAAFAGNLLEYVKLPSTLMQIGTQAFAATNNKRTENQITNVEFPKETDFRLSIRTQAFSFCALKEVILPKDTLQVAVTSNSTRPCVFTGNIGKEPKESIPSTATNVEKQGGIVYMYMELTPGKDISLIANTETGFPYPSANQKLITDSTIVEVKQAVQDAENAIGEAFSAKDEIEYAEDKDAALAEAEAKAEAAAKAVENAEKLANAAKAKYEEGTTEADLMEECALDAKFMGLSANKVLAEVKTEAANKALEKANEAKKAADAAATTPGAAAVTAAQAAETAAREAANKANTAKTAADKVIAVMKEMGIDQDDDPDTQEYVNELNEIANKANEAAQNANKALQDATAALNSAVNAKAEADRQGVYNASLPKVKISKPKAAKKAVTVKWKKLTKKNQKKADKIEVWVCPNKNFGAADTKVKTVSKKKASVKVKGLGKKQTYYVKVRSIKTINGVKNVGAWSKVKKVKTK